MLTAIRDRITGWLARLILALLLLAFAFWGAGFYGNENTQLSVAKVNGEPISRAVWQRAYNRMLREMQERSDDELKEEEEEFIRQKALEAMIHAELVNQIVAEENLQISDEMIHETITNLSFFQEQSTGFDRRQYERSLLSQGMDPVYFEAQLRLDMLSEQLQAAVMESTFVLDSEVQRFARLRNQKRDIQYGVISTADISSMGDPDDEAVQEFYEKNSSDYMDPEQIRIAYAVLDMEEIAKQLEVDEEELLVYYEENRDSYDNQQRSVSQLIARVAEGASPDDVEKAERAINAALESVHQGKALSVVAESFAEEETEETIAGLDYTEYPSIEREILPATVDAFVFSAAEGDISEVIRSELGFHVVKIDSVTGNENTFDNLREKAEQEYRELQAEGLFYDRLDRLISSAYEHPDTLEIAAEEAGLSLQESDFFSRSGEAVGILGKEKVLKAAFSDAVKRQGNNSDAVELDDGRVVVLRVIDTRPASLKPLEQIRDRVVEAMMTEYSFQQAKARGEKILSALAEGVAPADIAEKFSLEWNERKAIERDDKDTPRLVLRHAFGLARPAEGKSSFTGVQGGAGDYYVMVVNAVQDVDAEDVADDLRKAVREEMLGTVANREWWMFITDAETQADIRKYQ